MRPYRYYFVPLVIVAWAWTAQGQTDENLLLNPWEKGQAVEARVDGYMFPSASLSERSGSLKLFEVESYGRYRYDLGYELNPTVGYDLTYLNLQQHHPDPSAARLPRQLTDLSVGLGSPLTKIGDRGFLAATGAIGYAGDDAFAEGRASYAKGSIMYGQELKKGTNLLLILDYDGNRSYAPDVPLPAIAYSSRYNDQLAYVIGFPVNSLLWDPTPKVNVVINVYVPDSVNARVNYDLGKHAGLFAGYNQRTDVFHTREIPGDKRLFFKEQRVEGGMRWRAAGLRFEVAAGYAFGRGFDSGFDSRDLNRVTKVSNEPFARFSITYAQ
jgi:hypothetical protein